MLHPYMPHGLVFITDPTLLLLIYCSPSNGFAAFPLGAIVNIIFDTTFIFLIHSQGLRNMR